MAQHTHIIANPFSSEGVGIEVQIDSNTITSAAACSGHLNPLGLYHPSIATRLQQQIDAPNRIAHPYVRRNGRTERIDMAEAVRLMANAAQGVAPERNAVMISGQHPCELIYQLQKFARCGLRTGAVGSFRYMDAHPILNINKNDIVPLHELLRAKHIYVVDDALCAHHPIVQQLLLRLKANGTPITLISSTSTPSAHADYADSMMRTHSPLHLFRALNHHLLTQQMAHGIFVDGLAQGFDRYREQLTSLNAAQLLEQSGLSADQLQTFAHVLTAIPETVVLLSEHCCTPATLAEVRNLMLLTEKQAKPSSGLIYLKAECNSQGLFDMGAMPLTGPGGIDLTQPHNVQRLQSAWGVEPIPTLQTSLQQHFNSNEIQNLFIFGENSVADTPWLSQNLDSIGFVCAQSMFENETTARANLVIPMNMGIEIDGSYASSFRTLQTFRAALPAPNGWNDYQFAQLLLRTFGVDSPSTPMEILLEAAEFMPTGCQGAGRHYFTWIDA